MKRYAVVLLSLFIVSCNGGCHFSKGYKKDVRTGLTSRYNGLSVSEVYLANGEVQLYSNKVPMESKVLVVAKGLSNFTLREGKVFPGCRMVVTDKAGNKVLNIPDLFEAYTDKGVAPEDARTVSASLTVGRPMTQGNTYHLAVDIFDKLDKSQHLEADVDLVIE